MNLVLRPMDPSDPWTLLNLKRGVLRGYHSWNSLAELTSRVCSGQAAPRAPRRVLQGDRHVPRGIVFLDCGIHLGYCYLQRLDLSQSLVRRRPLEFQLTASCLAMFWVAVNNDLKPFRPVRESTRTEPRN